MLTPHCSAASGMVVPPSIVPTTRLRRSAEYGFAMPAGLLPADSLNHIRDAMGIPDSAFPGNALTAPDDEPDGHLALTRMPWCRSWSGVATGILHQTGFASTPMSGGRPARS